MTTTDKSKTVKAAAPKAPAQDAFAIPSLSALEVPPVIRDIAENSVAQTKEAYEKIKASAEEATSILGSSIEKTRDGVAQLNAKAIEAARANTEAAMTHAKDVIAVKSLSEAIELQAAFTKNQINAMQDQVKTFQEITAKITEETTAFYKLAFQKTTEAFKVA